MEDIINEQKAHPWYMSIEYFDSKMAWSPQTGRNIQSHEFSADVWCFITSILKSLAIH